MDFYVSRHQPDRERMCVIQYCTTNPSLHRASLLVHFQFKILECIIIIIITNSTFVERGHKPFGKFEKHRLVIPILQLDQIIPLVATATTIKKETTKGNSP